MPFYAVYFDRNFPPGDHWTDHLPEKGEDEEFKHGKHRAQKDDSDRKQHWKKGELYSMGTVLADPLPAHLKAKEIDPPKENQIWDVKKLEFVNPVEPIFHIPGALKLYKAGFRDAAKFLEEN